MIRIPTLATLALTLTSAACTSHVADDTSGGTTGSGSAASTSSTGPGGGTGAGGGTSAGSGGSGGGSIAFTNPGQMVLDGDGVVLTGILPATGRGALLRTTPGGGPVTVLAGGAAPVDIGPLLAADAAHYYFYVRSGIASEGSLLSLARSGGTPVKLADTEGTVLGLTVDATSLYWAEDFTATSSGSVKAVPLAGGAPAVIATDQEVTGGLVVVANDVYWTVEESAPPGPPIGSIRSAPIAGGPPTTLATNLNEPVVITSDGSSLFWLDYGTQGVDCPATNGDIMKMPIGGGTPVTLAENLASAFYLVVSGGAAYFTALNTACNGVGDPISVVGKVPVGGGAVVDLASILYPAPTPGALVVNGPSLYYTAWAYTGPSASVMVVGD